VEEPFGDRLVRLAAGALELAELLREPGRELVGARELELGAGAADEPAVPLGAAERGRDEESPARFPALSREHRRRLVASSSRNSTARTPTTPRRYVRRYAS
jgi:hypothetical protein